MKPEEAINAIKNNMPTKGTYTILTEGLELAITALEKQIPQLVPDDEECPRCGNAFISTHFCDNCGQALLWFIDNEEEEE